MLYVRLATSADIADLYRLDQQAFQDKDVPALEAAPGEFEQGVSDGEVYLAEVNGEAVGFIHVETVADRRIFLASIGVDAAHRQVGIGGALLEAVIERARAQRSAIQTATDPRNLPMIGLLTGRGFLIADYIPDYFSTGQHRYILVADSDLDSCAVLERVLIPVDSPSNSVRVSEPEWYIRRIVRVGGRAYYEHVRLGTSESRQLRPEEANSGIAFSGWMLTALTFLLGFALSTGRLGNDVRLILGAAVVLSLLSVLVYANALGELARLHSTRFTRSMELGNMLSEYGGIIPLLAAVPVALASVVDGWSGRFAIGGVGSLVLSGYLLSSFALWHRYQLRVWSIPALLSLAVSPVAYVLLDRLAVPDFVWSLMVLVALAVAYAALFFSPGETLSPGGSQAVR